MTHSNTESDSDRNIYSLRVDKITKMQSDYIIRREAKLSGRIITNYGRG